MSPSPESSSSPENPKPTQSSVLGDFLTGKTPGVKNIEAAYVRGGASNHHTPGHGRAEAKQGVGSEKFTAAVGDQRSEPSAIGKMFNNIINGTDHTK